MKKNWHAFPLSDIFSELKSSEDGLSQREAKKRLQKYGYNELPEEKGNSTLSLLISQFNGSLMFLMMAATAVSFVVKDKIMGFFILCVMLSNALASFYQEYKANKSLKSLRTTIQLRARVVRSNKECEIDAKELVPGDVVVLRAGDKVPADGRILQSKNLRISEAALTGEAKPVDKNTLEVKIDAEIADQTNMIFMGTIVEEGSATALITTTGANTQYGDIIEELKSTPEEPTPLQKIIISLSKYIGIFIGAVVLLIIIMGVIAGRDFHTIFETSLALFVSAIPEGLLPGITIVLVLGMRHIIRKKGLVRRLAATETLGGITVICTDKTGTLTEGKMKANVILTGEDHVSLTLPHQAITSVSAQMATRISILATDAYIENPGAKYDDLIVRGNLTEQALLRMGVQCELDPYTLAQEEEVEDNILFSSDRKYSASLRRTKDGKRMLYVLGAPEIVLEKVTHLLTNDGEKKLLKKELTRLINEKDDLIKKGYRVIACAYRTIKKNEAVDIEKMTEGLTFAGCIAITDPVRADAPLAFEKTKHAGIHTVIVTGDHAATARHVAEQIGLVVTDTSILEGHQIEAMSDDELFAKVKDIILYARVSPRHKLRIVHALQKQGEVVAMFGDGVNDAPALKAADIGVAVDTRVSAAREVADIVLLDGGFNTVIEAIEQGRIIFQNIRKVFLYLITQDFSSFFIFIASILLGLPLPVMAAQMLFVDLVESGLPDLALTTEQEKDGIMDEPPRDPKETILNKQAAWWMTSVFAVGGIVLLTFYILTLRTETIETARTMIMAFLCIESLLLAFTVRSLHRSVIRKDVFSNYILNVAVLISFGMVLLVVYLPWLQHTLQTVPLDGAQWSTILIATLCEIIIIDRLKVYFFRRHHQKAQILPLPQ